MKRTVCLMIFCAISLRAMEDGKETRKYVTDESTGKLVDEVDRLRANGSSLLATVLAGHVTNTTRNYKQFCRAAYGDKKEEKK